MSQRNRILIGVVVLVVIIGVFAGAEYIQRRNASSAQGDIPPGGIPIYLDGYLAASFVPNDLDHLGMMSFVEEEEGKTEEGWLISAKASERTIDVELEELTKRTTRMRVVANKGDIFFKDSATATEIVVQTAEALEK